MSESRQSLILVIGLVLVCLGGLGFGAWIFFADDEHAILDDEKTVGQTDTEETRLAPRRDLGTPPGEPTGEPGENPAPEKPAPSEARLTGTVRHGETLEGVRAAALLLKHSDGRVVAELFSGEGGRFQLDVAADLEDLILQAAFEGLVSAPIRDFELLAGETHELGDLLLEPAHLIRGRVLDTGGAALPGAEIQLVHSIPIEEVGSDLLALFRGVTDETRPLKRAQSDEQGRFEILGLAPGTYGLITEKAGYRCDVSPQINLKTGQVDSELTIKLEAGSQVSGRVVDEDDAAIEGALIAVLPRMEGLNGHIYTVKARSDADGRFAFTMLGEGRQNFVCKKEGFAPRGDRFNADEDQVLEIRMKRGVTLAGRVLMQGSDEPIPDVQITVINNRAPVLIETRSDAGGRFELKHLPQIDQCMFVLRKEGLEATESEGVEMEKGPFTMLRLDLDAKAPGPFERDLYMVGGGIIRGRIQMVRSGEAVAGARVYLVDERTASAVEFLGLGTGQESDADGRFEFQGVAAGAYRIVVASPGQVMAVYPDRKQFFDPTHDLCAGTIAAGQVIEGVVVEMTPSQSQKGRVVDREGRAVAGAVIARQATLESRGHDRIIDILLNSGDHLVSDAEGEFEISGLRAGDPLLIEARHPEFPGGAEMALESHEIGRERVELVMQPGRKLHGRVTDTSGDPVAQVSVVVTQTSGLRILLEGKKKISFRARTDEDGRYAFDDLPAARFRIECQGEDFLYVNERSVAEVDLTTITELEQSFELLRNGKISGLIEAGSVGDDDRFYIEATAIDPGGILVEEEAVRAEQVGPPTLGRGRAHDIVQKDGRFSLERLDHRFLYRLEVMTQRAKIEATRRERDARAGRESTAAPPEILAVIEDVEVGTTDLVIRIP